MPRGGKRNVSPRQAPGGPGRYSRRTDGQQIATPGLSGSDLQFGDVEKLERAQKTVPLPSGGGSPQAQRPVGERRPTGSGPSGRSGGVPKHLLEMDPEVAGEPTTSGLDVGDGPGSEVLDAALPAPDQREQALEYLFLRYRNNDAFRMLQGLRAERGAVQQQPAVAPTEEPAPALEEESV